MLKNFILLYLFKQYENFNELHKKSIIVYVLGIFDIITNYHLYLLK